MKNIFRSEIFYVIIQGSFFLFLLTVTGAIIIGFVPIKHSWFSNKAVSLLKNMGADSCMINSVEIIAWRAIKLQGVSFIVRVDSFNEYQVKLSKATLSINLIQFFMHSKKMNQVFHSGITKYCSPFLSRPETFASGLLTLGNILKEGIYGNFEDVWLTIKTNGKTAFLGAGGAVTMTAGKEKKDNVILHLQFPIITTYGDGMQNIQCTAILVPDGTLVIQNLSGSYFDGKVRARGTIELFDNQSTTYSLMIDKMDMAYWYSVHVGIGELTGSATIHCKGDNIPLHQLGRAMNCTVNINKCNVSNLPVQQSLATSLFIPSLTTIAFDKIAFTARKNADDTVYASFNGRGDDIEFTTSGWVLMNGKIEQQIEGTFSEAMVSRFPPDIRPILASENNRGWKFGCRLNGTYADPRFELDKETLQRAIGGLFQNIQQDITKELMK